MMILKNKPSVNEEDTNNKDLRRLGIEYMREIANRPQKYGTGYMLPAYIQRLIEREFPKFGAIQLKIKYPKELINITYNQIRHYACNNGIVRSHKYCRYGHQLTAKNEYLTTDGRSMCKTCVRTRNCARNKKLIELGLCVYCGKRKLFTKQRCLVCRNKDRVYRQKYNDKLEEFGLCSKCYKEKRKIGKKSCESCLKLGAISSIRRMRKLIENGMCPKCGKLQIDRDGVYCKKCCKERRNYNKHKKQSVEGV